MLFPCAVSLLLLLLFPQNALAQKQPSNVPAHVALAYVQAENLQAKARLASCQHAVGVLLLQGYVQLQNETQQEQMALVQTQQQLQQSTALLKKAYCDENAKAPSTESIVQCIQLYSNAYGQVNNGADSGVGTPGTDAEITTAIGQMMRRTSQLQASLEQ